MPTAHEVTHTEILHRVAALEAKIDELQDLIKLQAGIKVGGQIVQWIARMLGAAMFIYLSWKVGLGAINADHLK